MKNQIIIISIILFQLLSVGSVGQTVYTKSDTTGINQDSVVLKIDGYRGNIQWQYTENGETWRDLNETKDSLVITNEDIKERGYRAKVVEGTCLPVYSDTAIIRTNDSVVTNLIIADDNYELVSDSFDIVNGIFKYINFPGNDFFLDHILFDKQSGGKLRIINEVITSGDTTVLITSQGTMEDLFFDNDFKLSTEFLTPTENLKNASIKKIGETLTDNNGFIHPYQIIYQTQEGDFTKSVLTIGTEGDTTIRGGILYQDIDFSNLYLLYINDGVDESVNHYNSSCEVIETHSFSNEYQLRLKVTEGYFKFDPVFKFEFDFDVPSINWDELTLNKGELRHFKFYSDSSKIDFQTNLLLEATDVVKFEAKKTLYEDIVTAQYYFLIPPGIPAMIEIGLDILTKLSAEVSSAISASAGFHHTQFATLGAEFNEETGWETICDLPGTQTVEPLEFSGNAKLTERLDIYPHVDIKLYDIFGPTLEIIPYISEDITYSLDNNWDSGIDLGVDGTVGVDAAVLGETLWEYEVGTFNIFNYRLYQVPDSLLILDGNNQSAIVGETLTNDVKLEVKDRLGYSVADVKVYFNPLNGSTGDEFRVTDTSGVVSTQWTLSDTAGINNLEVFLKNGRDEIIEHTKLILSAEGIITVPDVLTLNADNVTTSSARIDGNIVSDGGGEITRRGFYWSQTDVTPDINDNIETVSGTTGTYNTSLSGLQSNTTYYYRAFATNIAGTATGTVRSFKTQEEEIAVSGTFTDSRDQNTYKWVKIGNQIWMAENLAYLPSVSPSSEGSNTTQFYYVYDYEGINVEIARQDSNYAKYGVLYNWTAATDACPDGWHLPGDAEWEQLALYISEQMGPYSKSQDDWTGVGNHLKVTDWGGSNDFGFSALPGGYRYGSGAFGLAGSDGWWWSATTTGMTNHTVWMRFLSSFSSEFGRTTYTKNYGLSVRCIKN